MMPTPEEYAAFLSKPKPAVLPQQATPAVATAPVLPKLSPEFIASVHEKYAAEQNLAELDRQAALELEKAKKADQYGNFAGRAIVRGVQNTLGSIGGLTAIGGELLGSDAVRDTGLESAKFWQDKAAEIPGMAMSDIEGPGTALKWVAEKALENAPFMLTSVGAAGAGGQIASRLIPKVAGNFLKNRATAIVGKEAGEEVLKAAMGKAARNLGARYGVIGTTAAIESGGDYPELVERGKGGDIAALTTLATGIGKGYVETLGGSQRIIDKVLGTETGGMFRRAVNGINMAFNRGKTPGPEHYGVIRRVLGEAMRVGREEGLEEVIQEGLALTNIAINDPTFKIFAAENLPRMLESGLAGFGVGAILGAPAGGFTNRETYAKERGWEPPNQPPPSSGGGGGTPATLVNKQTGEALSTDINLPPEESSAPPEVKPVRIRGLSDAGHVAVLNDEITEEQASVIARYSSLNPAMPQNEAFQNAAIDFAKANPDAAPNLVSNFIRAVRSTYPKQDADPALLNEGSEFLGVAGDMAQYATAKQDLLSEQIAALNEVPASKKDFKPAADAFNEKYGTTIKNATDRAKLILDLQAEQKRWNNWYANPKLKAEALAKSGPDAVREAQTVSETDTTVPTDATPQTSLNMAGATASKTPVVPVQENAAVQETVPEGAVTNKKMVEEIAAYRDKGAITSKAVKGNGLFVAAAFQDKTTGKIYPMKGIHNTEELPPEVIIGHDEEGMPIGSPTLVSGFIDREGKFYNRDEASTKIAESPDQFADVSKMMPDQSGNVTDMIPEGQIAQPEWEPNPNSDFSEDKQRAIHIFTAELEKIHSRLEELWPYHMDHFSIDKVEQAVADKKPERLNEVKQLLKERDRIQKAAVEATYEIPDDYSVTPKGATGEEKAQALQVEPSPTRKADAGAVTTGEVTPPPVTVKPKTAWRARHEGDRIYIDSRSIGNDTPAISALKGAGVKRDGGYMIRDSMTIPGKYDIVQAQGNSEIIAQRGLSLKRAQEYISTVDDRRIGEITDVFDNTYIMEPNKKRYKLYDDNARANEDDVKKKYIANLYANGEIGTSDPNDYPDITLSTIVERGRKEIEALIQGKSPRELDAELARRGGMTDEELADMEAAYNSRISEEPDGRDEAEGIEGDAQDDIAGEVPEISQEEIPDIDEDAALREWEDFLSNPEGVDYAASEAKPTATEAPAPESAKGAEYYDSALTDLIDSSDNKTVIPQGSPHYKLADGRVLSVESYNKLVDTGAQEGLGIVAEKRDKEPWEMTKDEYRKQHTITTGDEFVFADNSGVSTTIKIGEPKFTKGFSEPSYKYSVDGKIQKTPNPIDILLTWKHRAEIERANNQNKPVPKRVLKDYPDLEAKYFPKAPPASTLNVEDKQTSMLDGEEGLTGQRDMFEEGGNNPPTEEAEYVTFKEVRDAERNTYFDSENNRIASSREKSQEPSPYKTGQWKIDSSSGIYGRNIEQLREIPVDQLEIIEEDYTTGVNYEGRGDDARRYAQWAKEGRPIPPIDVVESDSGTLRIIDGHRRLAAAKMAGLKTIPAWVSPRMDTGKRTPDGKPIYAGLTFEGAKYGAAQAQRIWEEKNKSEIERVKTEKASRETLSTLRMLGQPDHVIEAMTPSERDEYIRLAEEAAESVPYIETGKPQRGDAFISTGDKGAMYTLRVAGVRYSDYLVNLSRDKNEAIKKARMIAAARGKKAVYWAAPEELNDYEDMGGGRGSQQDGMDDVNGGTPLDVGSLHADTPQAILSGAGLQIQERTAKSGTTYWTVSGNTQAHRNLLDKLGFKNDIKINGIWVRSYFGSDPTAKLADAIKNGIKEEAIPEIPLEEARKIVGAAKLIVVEKNGVWYVSGNTYDNRVALARAGGVFNQREKAYEYNTPGNPSGRIAYQLREIAGQNAKSGAQLDDDARLANIREREDSRIDERADGENRAQYVSDESKRLIRNGIKYGIPEDVVNEQIEDAGAIVRAFEKEKPVFILANAPGGGKTYIVGAAIREMKARGAKKIIYFTLSQDLIAQIKNDLADYGINDVEFHTYAELSKDRKMDTADAVLVFDEAHNIKNIGGDTARAETAQKLIPYARITVMVSATPFENPVEARYIEATGLFNDVGGFEEWAKAYGAAVKTYKFRNPYTGGIETKEVVYWPGGKGKVKDGIAAREWFFKQGVMSQRPMKIDPSMVDVQFNAVQVSPEYETMYRAVDAAYQDALEDLVDSNGAPTDRKTYSAISMHRVNTLKRILEASKIPFAIERAKALRAQGKNVVMFVETKADRTLGMWRKAEREKDRTLYSYADMQRIMGEWQMEANAARAMREKVPPPPFAGFIYQIAGYFDMHGISFELPSTSDEIVRALGESNVAVYTGEVSDAKARNNKDDFLSGRKWAIVATMAKGGTGLSLHDKVGNRPTVQVNVNLPWKASGVDQVSGRVARYGLRSRALVEWIFAKNIPFELNDLAPRVGNRMADMGAIVSGIKLKMAKQLTSEEWDFEGAVDVKGEAGDTNSTGSGEKYSARQQQWYYSQMRRTLESKLPNRGAAGAFRGMIESWANKGEFKAEELEWSGLLDADGPLSGTGTVSKDDVLAWLDANNVRVEEVMKGGSLTKEQISRIAKLGKDIDKVNNLRDTGGQLSHYAASDRIKKLYEDAAKDTGLTIRIVKRLNRRIGNLNNYNLPTKFSQWQEPGGENYRELLLTLPAKSARPELDNAARRIAKKDGVDYDSLSDEDQRAYRRTAISENEGDEIGSNINFKSTHFDTPNILAHVRFNERTDADGNRVLFVEEIQSDWHQAGREHGYKGAIPSTWAVRASEKEEGWLDVIDENGEWRGIGRTKEAAVNDALKLLEHTGAVPNAPFKKSWPMLAMKRMIRYAAENGFDSIAWTTGEMQIDRYEEALRQRVDEIRYEPAGDGLWEISASKNGRDTFNEDEVDIERIKKLFGKDIAKKIENDEGERIPNQPYRSWRKITGEGLSIGGEGMKGFYDQILPAEVNRYVKKWGAKVGETKISKMTASEVEPDIFGDYNDPIGGFGTEYVPVHSLTITPAMREAALAGQPLFKAGGMSPKYSGITLADVRKMFPRAIVTEEPDGSFSVRVGSKKPLIIRSVASIIPDEFKFKVGYGRSMKPGEVIAGKYDDGEITVSRHGDTWTLGHEGYHWLEDIGVVSAIDKAALNSAIAVKSKKKFTEVTEEDRAAYIEDALKSRAEARNNVIKKLIQKIRDFIDGLVNLAHRTARGVVRDVESGKMAEREGRGAGSEVRYRGYDWDAGKSNNAVDAEASGKHPITVAARKVAKATGITISEARRILEENGTKEWHHSSKFYNRVEYYETEEPIRVINHMRENNIASYKEAMDDLEDIQAAELEQFRKENDEEGLNHTHSFVAVARDRKKSEGGGRVFSHYRCEICGKIVTDENSPEIKAAEQSIEGPVPPRSKTSEEVKGVQKDRDGMIAPEAADVNEKFQTPSGETRYSSRPLSQSASREEVEDDFDKYEPRYLADIGNTLKSFLSRQKEGWSPSIKEDVSKLARVISLPMHYTKKVPGLFRSWQARLMEPDLAHEYQNAMFRSDHGEHKYLEEIDAYYRHFKEESKKWKRYVFVRDRDNIRWTVKKGTDQNGNVVFDVLNPSGAVTQSFVVQEPQGITPDDMKFQRENNRGLAFGYTSAEADALKSAWRFAYEAEADATGFSEEGKNALIAYRTVADRELEFQMSGIQDAMDKLKKKFKVLPTVPVWRDGDRVEISLDLALLEMGQLRGAYMPRIRKQGEYAIYATKEGENPRLEFFSTKSMQKARFDELTRDGFTAIKDISKVIGNDVFSRVQSTAAIQDILQSSIDRMTDKIPEGALGIEGFNSDLTPQNDGTHTLFVTGKFDDAHRDILRSYSKNATVTKNADGTETWAFKKANAGTEKVIARDFLQYKAIIADASLDFAHMLVDDVAETLRSRSSLARRIGRKKVSGKDVVLGYETDPLVALTIAGKGIAASAAKHQVALRMYRCKLGTDLMSWDEFKEWKTRSGEKPDWSEYRDMVSERRIDTAKQPEAAKEWQELFDELMRQSSPLDNTLGTFRGVASLMYLWGRIPSAFINLTTLGTSIPAAISGYTGVGIGRAFHLVAAQAKAYDDFRNGRADTETALVFEEIINRGWHEAQFNKEAVSVLKSRLGRSYDTFIDAGMYFFGVAEKINRIGSIAAAYRALKEQAGITEMSFDETMLERAKEISDAANGVYTSANLPSWARGSGIYANAARSFYVFRTYTHTYLVTMADMFMQGGVLGQKGWMGENANAKRAALWMATAGAIFAGAGSSVLFSAVMAGLGLVRDDDPEEEFYAWVLGNFGETGERVARYGFAGAVGVNIKGSMQIAIGDMPSSIPELLGAPGSIVTNSIDGLNSIRKGDAWKGTEKLMPYAISAPMKAYRESTEGITSKANAPLFYGDERVRLEPYETALRLLSFQPARVSAIKERQWNEKQVEMDFQKRRAGIYDRVRAFWAKPVDRRDKAEWMDILERAAEYNESVKRLRTKSIPRITTQSINQAKRMTSKPPKKERERAKTME